MTDDKRKSKDQDQDQGHQPNSEGFNDSNTKSLGRTAWIGFWGGLIWSAIGFFAYYLKFTKYGPALILYPWALGSWKKGLYGQITSVVVIALLSILIAFIYKWILGKIKSMWVSIGFGIAIWVMVFYIIQPWIPGLLPVFKVGVYTISTTLSLYILYGLFIGYSISFDIQTHATQTAKEEKT